MRDATKFPGRNALEKMQGSVRFSPLRPRQAGPGQNVSQHQAQPKAGIAGPESTVRDAAPVVEVLIREEMLTAPSMAQPRETAEASCCS